MHPTVDARVHAGPFVLSGCATNLTVTAAGDSADGPLSKLSGNVATDKHVALRTAVGTPAARIAHTAFALACLFTSLAVATPAATVLTVAALSVRLTLAADIALAVAAMNDFASVAVGGVFLLAGVASGVNVTHGTVTLLHVDALSRVITANRRLAKLTVSTNGSPSAASLPCPDRPSQLTA